MSPFTFLASLLALSLSLLLLTSAHAATVDVTNRCTYTVWAAAAWPSSPPLGRRLDNGQSWQVNVPPGTVQARVWGRTNCNGGRCETGDCNNGALKCTGYGQPPQTLAEFALNQPNNLDYYDISLVDGFNIPMEFSPVNDGACKDLTCTAPITAECPSQLKAPGGCNNPCTVYKTNEYCCTNGQGSCGPTTLSKFFKQRCPDAYSYPQDDPTSLFTCRSGTNYKVVFCP